MASPTREQFALTGPSRPLDPRIHAVRQDLADIRLASIVFAPHYAASVAVLLTRTVALRAAPEAEAEEMAILPAGTRFEVLERSGGRAWGVASDPGLVGYLDEEALGSLVAS